MVKIYYSLVIHGVLSIDQVPQMWRYYVIDMINRNEVQ